MSEPFARSEVSDNNFHTKLTRPWTNVQMNHPAASSVVVHFTDVIAVKKRRAVLLKQAFSVGHQLAVEHRGSKYGIIIPFHSHEYFRFI